MNHPYIVSDLDHENVRERVSLRTLELARLAGREPHQIKQADYEQAKRECDLINRNGEVGEHPME